MNASGRIFYVERGRNKRRRVNLSCGSTFVSDLQLVPQAIKVFLLVVNFAAMVIVEKVDTWESPFNGPMKMMVATN